MERDGSGEESVGANCYQVMPALTPEEYETLKAGIAAHGVLVPVEIDEQGNILDGHHRVQACQELGIKDWPTVIRAGLSEEDKRAHARRLNLNRRHLTQERRRDLIRQQLMETPEKSDNWLATLLGVTDKTVHTVREEMETTSEIPKLERFIGVDGKSRPAMRPAVITKSNSETRRVLNILAKLPTEALPGKVLDVRRVERIGREYRPAQQQQTADVSLATTRLLFGDMRQRGDEIADASVDLIFCDPPYGEEFLPLWSALSRLAARVLKRGGLLVAYTGQVFLPEVMGRLAQHLRYWWQGALVLNGPQVRIYSHRMANGSKPLLFYSRNDGAPEYAWCEDTYVSEKRDKDLHEWQQSIGAARHFISRLTALGDTVLDPFLGSGTTGAAALELGRHFIGIECDSVAFATAQERLSNITTAHENEAA